GRTWSEPCCLGGAADRDGDQPACCPRRDTGRSVSRELVDRPLGRLACRTDLSRRRLGDPVLPVASLLWCARRAFLLGRERMGPRARLLSRQSLRGRRQHRARPAPTEFLARAQPRDRRRRLAHAGRPLRPYGGVGAGSLVPHVEAQSDSASVDEYQWFRGISARAQVGVQWRLPGPAGIFLEYRLTFAYLRVSVPGGDLSTWLRTHHLVAGAFVTL